MSDSDTLTCANKIFQAIFGRDNPHNLDALYQKFAFDIKLPTAVKDSTTGETTYSAMPNAQKFMTCTNIEKRGAEVDWLLPKQDIKSLSQVLEIWRSINYTTTERVYGSEFVAKSDPIYHSNNVYASTNCGDCDHIIFCDGTYDSNFALACQRSTGLNFCLRVDDSNTCTNSYNVICSSKVNQSFFIQDASNLNECMFCSHISNQRFCIANMQFQEAEYRFLKEKIITWILDSNPD